jgi:hypothetical protein
MRNAIVGTLVTVAALGAASTANASARYGGTAVVGPYMAGPSIGVFLGDDGSVSARASTSVCCHNVDVNGVVVRLKGATSGAAGFTAAGHTRLRRHGRLEATLSGTFNGPAATGKVKFHANGCKGFTRAFTLRAASAPAGASVAPAQSRLFGTTSQSAGIVPLSVSLQVSHKGKVAAAWEALAICGNHAGPIRIPVLNVTPFTKIHSDGSFSRSEKYTIRYDDGSHDVFHVPFAGHFVSGGAVGTLRARVQYTDPKHQLHIPCVSGTQNWSATV